MQYFSFDRPSFGIKTFGFGANFDPLELFAGGKQGAWYDPSDKSTLFQDVAGTVPVTKDGDPVALMRDKSGNGKHAVQPVSTARPVYKTDGLLHWLYFDGVDDYLRVDILFNSVSVLSFFSSFRVISTSLGVLINLLGEGYVFINKAVSVDGMSFSYRPTAGGYNTVDNQVMPAYAEVSQDTINWSSGTYKFTNASTSREYSIDTNAPLQESSSLYIGSQLGIDFFYEGRLYGLLSLSDGVNNNVATETLRYLSAKSGVTL